MKIFLKGSYLIGLLILWCTYFNVYGVAQENAQVVAQKIIAERLHEKELAKTKLKEAQTLYDNKQYEDALDATRYILRDYPANKDAQKLLDQTRKKIDAYNAAKAIALKKKNMQRVMKNLDSEFISLFRRPEEYDKGAERRIKRLVDEVKSLWKKGRYDDAIEVCQEIIRFDPSNEEAQRRINELIADLRRYSEQDSDIVKRKRLIAVRHAWLPPRKKDRNKQKHDDELSNSSQIISKDKEQLLAKARRIIPEINFTNAHLRDVIQYLSKISGVNIILDEHLFPGDGYNAEEPDDRITIALKNIPLLEALKYILITKGMEFRIEDHAIWIAKDVEDIEMITRMYPLPAGTGIQRQLEYEGVTQEENLTGSATIGTGGDITQLLREAVPFPPGSKVFLDPRTSTLIVTNTVANHSLIEEVLKNITEAPLQVQIEAKFVEILENDGDELGLEFFLTDDYSTSSSPTILANTSDNLSGQYPSSAAGTFGFTRGLRFGGASSSIFRLSGVLSQPEFSVIMHALSQNRVTDVISAPKVTAINGQQAIIRDVTEIIYPLEFTVTQATFNDNGDAITPSVVEVGDFQTRKVGIVLSVTPDVGADKKTITLTILPEVSSVSTWINFGTSGAPIRVPHFSSENVVTTVLLNDGETVVLGGLIKEDLREYHDKIPFLGDIPYVGRLFRLDRESSQKTNLLIFVTAKIVTPTGEDYKEIIAQKKE